MLQGRLRPGEMDVPITIQSAITTKHAITNEPEETWSTYRSVRAKMMGPASNEKYEASQQVALSTVRFFVYRDTAYNERMRILKGDHYYYILGIQDFNRQGYMILIAEKRDNV